MRMPKYKCPNNCEGKLFTALFKVTERHVLDENGDTQDYKQADGDGNEGPLDDLVLCNECRAEAIDEEEEEEAIDDNGGK
jgi:hypothetical protein